MWSKTLIINLLFFLSSSGLQAQGYVDQEATASVSESQSGGIENVKPVSWHAYTFNVKGKSGLNVALKALNAHLDSLPGGQAGHRLEIVEMTNRARSKYFLQRHSLLIPDAFPED